MTKDGIGSVTARGLTSVACDPTIAGLVGLRGVST
jgi:hypothetical protein